MAQLAEAAGLKPVSVRVRLPPGAPNWAGWWNDPEVPAPVVARGHPSRSRYVQRFTPPSVTNPYAPALFETTASMVLSPVTNVAGVR